MRGIIIKKEKDVPITHNYGSFVVFYCEQCGKQLCACYETDPLRGGGVNEEIHYCSRCGNHLDFGEYYHKK